MCNELTRESFDRPFSFIKLFGRKQQIQLVAAIKHVFQSTSPTRGDDDLAEVLKFVDGISIHVPYERGRRPACAACSRRWYFNPRPLREGTTPGTGVVQGSAPISIHVPYERGRRWFQRTFDSRIQFQSTSPTRGDDLLLFPPNHTPNYFNPRPLREGTTCRLESSSRFRTHFNPRPLREGTTCSS